jgi:hypothetical protein
MDGGRSASSVQKGIEEERRMLFVFLFDLIGVLFCLGGVNGHKDG